MIAMTIEQGIKTSKKIILSMDITLKELFIF